MFFCFCCANSSFAASPIKLTYPLGGEKWIIGQNYTVTWDYTGTGYKTAEVYLSYSNGKQCHLGSPLIESRAFSFMIPTECPSQSWAIDPGNYSISIYPNNGLDDDSDIMGAFYGKEISIVYSSNQNSFPVDGKCGPANNRTFKNFESLRAIGSCVTGNESNMQGGKENEYGYLDVWWSCQNLFGGKDEKCTARIDNHIQEKDNNTKKLIDQLKVSLENQGKTKNTYLGFVSSTKGKELVNSINSNGSPVVIATSKTAFCAMKKLLDDTYYCIDSTGFIGSFNACSKTNISCQARTISIIDNTNTGKYTREQLIALLLKMIETKKISTGVDDKQVLATEKSECDIFVTNKELSIFSQKDFVEKCKLYIKKDLNFCTTLADFYDKFICYSSLALNKNDFSICDKAPSEIIDTCYSVVIEKTGNSDDCDKFKDGEYKYNCYKKFKKNISLDFCETIKNSVFAYDDCLQEVAIEKKDTKICDKITHYDGEAKGSEICYQQIYINNNDTASCAKLSNNENLQEECFSAIALNKEDPFICKNIKSEYTDERDCVTDIAIKKEDISICKMEKESDMRYCYEKLAIKKNDMSICQKIEEDKSDSCYYYFINKAKFDNSICTSIKETLQDYCYRLTALENINHLSCGSLKNEAEKNACYAKIYISCDKIKGEEERNLCLSQIFEKSGTLNPDICKKMTNIDKANGCYFDIGYQSDSSYCDNIKNDQSLLELCYTRSGIKCEKLTDKSDIDSCYLRSAQVNTNSSICEKITDTKKKNYCYYWCNK